MSKYIAETLARHMQGFKSESIPLCFTGPACGLFSTTYPFPCMSVETSLLREQWNPSVVGAGWPRRDRHRLWGFS